MIVTRAFPTTPAIQRFLDSEYGKTALGRLKLFLEATDVALLQQKISTDLLSRAVRVDVGAARGGAPETRMNILQGFFNIMQRNMRNRLQEEVEFEIGMIRESVNVGAMTLEEAKEAIEDIGTPQSAVAENYSPDVIQRQITGAERDILEYFEYTETKKMTGKVREAFIGIHLLYLANMSGFLVKSMEAFSRVQGHLTETYINNINLLPYYLGTVPVDEGFTPMRFTDTLTDPIQPTSTQPTSTQPISTQPISPLFSKSRENILPEIIGFMPLLEPLNEAVFVLY